jgi:STE24 endopeptidase
VSDPAPDARRYHRRQLVLSALDLAATLAVLLAWVATGAALRLAGGLGAPDAGSLQAALAVLVLSVAVAASCLAATFPLDLVGGFLLPRRAGLLTQPLRGWLADRAKALALGGGLGLIVVEAAYALLRWSPGWWWLWTAAGLTGLGVLLTLALPVWIVPLFYRITPLGDADLHARLLGLARRMGVAAADVVVADFSRKGRTANAAVVGLGGTRRILVSDTLLARFPVDEVEVVLAHELGHHARGHLRQGLLVQGAVMGASLWLAAHGLTWGASRLALEGPADPAGLPLLGLLVTGIGLLTTPVLAAWSRHLEREADQVALDVTRDPRAFEAAMERLADLNLAERQPHRLKEWLWASHPSIERRIAAARRFAGEQGLATPGPRRTEPPMSASARTGEATAPGEWPDAPSLPCHRRTVS